MIGKKFRDIIVIAIIMFVTTLLYQLNQLHFGKENPSFGSSTILPVRKNQQEERIIDATTDIYSTSDNNTIEEGTYEDGTELLFQTKQTIRLVKRPSSTATTTTTDSSYGNRDNFAIIVYIPTSESHVREFIAFAYASWKHITDKEKNFFPKDTTKPETLNNIDFLAFCHPQICPHIEDFCTKITHLYYVHGQLKPTCWAVEQPFETEINYTPLNSYIMFRRPDIMELPKKYKYIFRTDCDFFFTPPLWTLKPVRFLFGQGGYSDPFNMERLKEIAIKLGMVHRGRHDIGSTLCGETNLLIKIANKSYDATKHLFLNEFNPQLPGLDVIPFDKNPEGEWIRWWRPVSSMYGGELAINDLIPDISDENKGKFDGDSCSGQSIWDTNHIHCWHRPCHFSKFEFDDFLYSLLQGTKDLNNKLSKELVRNGYEKDTRNMTMQQFSSYIAYNAVGKYLQRYFQ